MLSGAGKRTSRDAEGQSYWVLKMADIRNFNQDIVAVPKSMLEDEAKHYFEKEGVIDMT
jgi:hypothetical protein